MPDTHILVVEDAPASPGALPDRLRSLALGPVHTASDAASALALCRRERVGLVLLDLAEGPPDAAVTLAQQLRRVRPLAVIHLAPAAGSPRLIAAESAPHHGILVGAFDDRELAAVVDAALYKHAADEALRRSEVNFRNLIERSPDAVAVVRDLRIVYVNLAAMQLVGVRRVQDLVGRSVLEIIHPDDRKATQEAVRDPTIGNDLVGLELHLLHRDGSTRTVELSTFGIIFDGTRATVAMGRDLTERKRMEVQLTLADRMASVGTLAAGVAHEVSNPLTYALHNLDWIVEALPGLQARMATLARGAPEDPAWGPAAETLELLGERAHRASEGLERVSTIIRDLKTFSRVDEETRAPVSIAQPLEAALNMAHNELKYRARTVLDLDPTPLVDANQGRLSQVFLNLLVNAAQAIPEGAVDTNEVRVRAWCEADEVRVEVADTGPGIPPAHRARLFDPFFTTKPAGVGSGLGLSICHNIVSAYGGRIEVDSEEGRGTRFTVVLPALEAPTVALATPSPARPVGVSPPCTEATSECRVLVVDDEPNIRRTLHNLLRPTFDVSVAESGAHARRLVEDGLQAEVILCDMMMPEVSGMDFHTWLQAHQPPLAERVVFMTGGAFTDRTRAYLTQTGRPSIEKPFRLDHLMAVISEVMQEPAAG